MAKIILQASSLLDAARKMDDAAERIDGALQRVDTIMSDVDAVWSDANSKTYLSRYEELKEEFPGFKEAIRNYSTFLNSVVAAYQREFLDQVSESIN